MDWKHTFFSGKGRLDRRDFWLATLLIAALNVLLRLLGPVGYLLVILLLFPHTCILSKRLHDLGWSGWFAGAPFAVCLICGVLVGLAPDDGHGPTGPLVWLAAIIALTALVLFFRVALAKGDATTNRYGDRRTAVVSRADDQAGGLV